MLPMGWCHFLTGCVLFWEMDPVFFGWERVNPLCCGREKIEPVYVVPVGICLIVVVKQEKPTASWRRLWWLGSIIVRSTPHGFCRHLDLVPVLGLWVKISTRRYVIKNQPQSVNCGSEWLCPWGWSERRPPPCSSVVVDMVRGKKEQAHDMRRPVVSVSGWLTVCRKYPKRL